jgi:hypothetical protein
METKNYLDSYIKYKSKYLKLKKLIKTQSGGSQDLAQIQIEKLNDIISKIEHELNKIKEKEPEYKIQLLGSKNIKFDSEELAGHKIQINNLVESLKNYIESNEIPVEISSYPFMDLGELEEGLNKLKTDLDFGKLKAKYKLRETIYSIDEKNYDEILDMIIAEYNINSPIDIEKIFKSTILGHNKNYIIGYMVLFRFLIKNKIQLSTINNNITYLTIGSIFTSLNNSINNEEYIGPLMELINQYIKTNPIKKVIQIRNPPEMEKIYGFKESQLFGEISEKIEFIDSYDSKNKVIIYKSGIVKDEKKANFDDLKQIINTLFRIPVFSK